jgi:hypothetical protein
MFSENGILRPVDLVLTKFNHLLFRYWEYYFICGYFIH